MPEAPIKVDIGQISRDVLGLLPTRDDQDRIVREMGAAALQFWKLQAQMGLRSSARDYVHALTVEEGDRKFTITLGAGPKGKEALPNMIENGFQGGDMRDWMLKGPKVKHGKNGKYLIIPFGHGTPGTGGRNVGPPMPTSIHEAAKRLKAPLSRSARAADAHQTTKPGERRLSAASDHVSRQARKLLTTKTRPYHASSIYKGIIREVKTYAKATQPKYTSFRVISEGINRGETDKEGKATQHWFHPGIRAAHYAQKTQRHIRKLAVHMLGAVTRNA